MVQFFWICTNLALIPVILLADSPDGPVILDEHTAQFLGRRPPLVHSTFERDNFHRLNTLPERPCSAYFFLYDDISSDEIFKELRSHGIQSSAVHCLQRNPTGHTYIIFTTDQERNYFLKKSSFVAHRKASYNIPGGSTRRTFVAVYDAPFELSNEAIAHRLAPYGKIDSHQFSVMQNHPGIYNGNRTFVFTPLRKHIPSFMQFGKFLLRIKYPGQP